MKAISIGYHMEEFEITPDNVSQFVIIEERRELSDTWASTLHGLLIQGRNPIGVLVVNKTKQGYRVIDGNHRIEAVRKFYSYMGKQNKERPSIKCILKVYDNLDREGERQVYIEEASRRTESMDDRLKVYSSQIKFYNLCNGEQVPFKVSIYAQKGSLKLRNVINALEGARDFPTQEYKANRLRRKDIVQFALALDYQDFINFKEFMLFFIKVFGIVDASNLFTKPPFFSPLYDIFTINKEFIQENEQRAIERFQRLIGHPRLISFVNLTGREAFIRIHKEMMELLNYRAKESQLFQ